MVLVFVLLVLRALELPLEDARVSSMDCVMLLLGSSLLEELVVFVMMESLGRFLFRRLYLCDAMQPVGYCSGEKPA